jgi:hypothetical protein
LADVLLDWEDSRAAFPNNVYLTHYWPIPFFGNPAAALVATVGVNPSSAEFEPRRRWEEVETPGQWKLRLKNYFNHQPPAHDWFGPWREGLDLLGVAYETGTAAHLDVSYRPTKAMLKNKTTDRREFRHMIERDVAWLFRLLPLCSKLRGLLVFGPVVRHDGSTESLAAFIRKSAPRHGFRVLPDGGIGCEPKGQPQRKLFLHEVASPDMGTITEQVVANLTQHRDGLHRRIHSGA